MYYVKNDNFHLNNHLLSGKLDKKCIPDNHNKIEQYKTVYLLANIRFPTLKITNEYCLYKPLYKSKYLISRRKKDIHQLKFKMKYNFIILRQTVSDNNAKYLLLERGHEKPFISTLGLRSKSYYN